MTEALLQALISGLAVGGAYALVALGFSITFTTTKTLNFSHGEFVSAGAFIGMSVLFLVLGKPVSSTTFGDAVPGASAQLLALVGALGAMGLLGWLLYVVGVRPFAGRPGMAGTRWPAHVVDRRLVGKPRRTTLLWPPWLRENGRIRIPGRPRARPRVHPVPARGCHRSLGQVLPMQR